MHFKGIKFAAVAVIAVLVFGLLLGGNFVYGKVTSDQPLFKSFQNVPEVKEVRIIKNTKKEMEILVVLAEVDDLAATYRNLVQTVQPIAGTRECRLLLTDERSDELVNAYYDIHYLIQEGIATGSFAAMAEQVDTRLSPLGLARQRVFVANDYVFVQLHRDGKYLYEVVPRLATAAVAVVPAETAEGVNG